MLQNENQVLPGSSDTGFGLLSSRLQIKCTRGVKQVIIREDQTLSFVKLWGGGGTPPPPLSWIQLKDVYVPIP